MAVKVHKRPVIPSDKDAFSLAQQGLSIAAVAVLALYSWVVWGLTHIPPHR